MKKDTVWSMVLIHKAKITDTGVSAHKQTTTCYIAIFTGSTIAPHVLDVIGFEGTTFWM